MKKDYKLGKITLKTPERKDEDFPITHAFPQFHWANSIVILDAPIVEDPNSL